MTFLKLKQNNNSFAIVWSQLLLVAFAYNFFTCFWMLGFAVFPTGIWYLFEITAEAITLADFFVRVGFARWLPQTWQVMLLLHTKDDKKILVALLRFVISLPYSLILSAVFKTHPARLTSIWVASTRLLKLCHFQGFPNYFDANLRNKNERAAFVFLISGTMFNFTMYLHVIAMIFIFPDRFQDDYGWFIVAGYK